MRLAIFVVALAACHPAPTPAPPPQPDASDSGVTSAATACANLAELTCTEGLADNCEVVLRHVDIARHTTIDIPCLSRASTKEAARRCGSFVECR